MAEDKQEASDFYLEMHTLETDAEKTYIHLSEINDAKKQGLIDKLTKIIGEKELCVPETDKKVGLRQTVMILTTNLGADVVLDSEEDSIEGLRIELETGAQGMKILLSRLGDQLLPMQSPKGEPLQN